MICQPLASDSDALGTRSRAISRTVTIAMSCDCDISDDTASSRSSLAIAKETENARSLPRLVNASACAMDGASAEDDSNSASDDQSCYSCTCSSSASTSGVSYARENDALPAQAHPQRRARRSSGDERNCSACRRRFRSMIDDHRYVRLDGVESIVRSSEFNKLACAPDTGHISHITQLALLWYACQPSTSSFARDVPQQCTVCRSKAHAIYGCSLRSIMSYVRTFGVSYARIVAMAHQETSRIETFASPTSNGIRVDSHCASPLFWKELCTRKPRHTQRNGHPYRTIDTTAHCSTRHFRSQNDVDNQLSSVILPPSVALLVLYLIIVHAAQNKHMVCYNHGNLFMHLAKDAANMCASIAHEKTSCSTLEIFSNTNGSLGDSRVKLCIDEEQTRLRTICSMASRRLHSCESLDVEHSAAQLHLFAESVVKSWCETCTVPPLSLTSSIRSDGIPSVEIPTTASVSRCMVREQSSISIPLGSCTTDHFDRFSAPLANMPRTAARCYSFSESSMTSCASSRSAASSVSSMPSSLSCSAYPHSQGVCSPLANQLDTMTLRPWNSAAPPPCSPISARDQGSFAMSRALDCHASYLHLKATDVSHKPADAITFDDVLPRALDGRPLCEPTLRSNTLCSQHIPIETVTPTGYVAMPSEPVPVHVWPRIGMCTQMFIPR